MPKKKKSKKMWFEKPFWKEGEEVPVPDNPRPDWNDVRTRSYQDYWTGTHERKDYQKFWGVPPNG